MDMPGRARLMLDDTSGYLAAPLPGQLSRTLPSGPFPSLAPASSSFGSFQAGNDTRLLGPLGNVNFGPNPGREPFGARFWPFGRFWAAIKSTFWDHWKRAGLDQILAGN